MNKSMELSRWFLKTLDGGVERADLFTKQASCRRGDNGGTFVESGFGHEIRSSGSGETRDWLERFGDDIIRPPGKLDAMFRDWICFELGDLVTLRSDFIAWYL